jgi:hypothetical protein
MSTPNDCADRQVNGDHGPGCQCAKVATCARPLKLASFNTDDGVWATCSGDHAWREHWARNLGYSPTVQDAVAAQAAHDAGEKP